jgi:hypothetical protein
MTFENALTNLISDALNQASGGEREVVRSLARVLHYAIDVTTASDEGGGSALRDEARDTLYGASFGCGVPFEAFGDDIEIIYPISFAAFANTPYPVGLDANYATITKLIADDANDAGVSQTKGAET